ncbi:MAG TPA: LacI family DNA-binding transcriptional regulator [Anaerolineaceae bacterium]|nr:LacI family DNA-binding transcriptional regulator [Anaerolineaceae bacterium]HPN50967.1 LacI family DNA-binding transcriptional regulator [Anaerolineaceae bacterium]
MPVTIRDLAKKLNLSITTVSRALDGYKDVSESTRQRVVNAAYEMGYQPSYAARQLRRKRADAIGYILPTSSPRFSDPLFSSFVSGLCDEASDHQIDLVVSSCPPETQDEQAMYHRWLDSRRVDGMVLNRTRVYDWRVEFLTRNKIPFTLLGKPDMIYDAPGIVVNERGGFESLVRHLAAQGHRRIAYIGASPYLTIQLERYAGYRQGLEAAGLPFIPELVVVGDLTEEGGRQAGLKLLEMENGPTAVLGINDVTALGVCRAVQDAGRMVGRDVAVAGYDGIKESEFANPPLTTLFQPTYEIARRLTAMLLGVINGETLPETRITLQPELMIRASTQNRAF